VLCDTMLTPFQRYSDWLLHIEKGKISGWMPASERGPIDPEKLIHIPGATVAPGFIDIHVHGASGRDLMDGTAETVRTVSRTLARYGTTAFVATTVSASEASTEAAVRGLAENFSAADGAIPLGIHLEGPYLNPLRRGTHDAIFLKPADVAAFFRFVQLSHKSICRLTVAPEIDRGLELIRAAVSLGIQVSIGHSDATFEQASAAVAAGATSATHTFNAMRPFHQREPGIVGAVLTDERVYAEAIADFVHVHPAGLKMLLRMKGIDRLPLVTDASSAMGMPDGEYPLGVQSISVKNGECRDREGHLAGSTLTLDRAVRNLVRHLDVPLHEALAAASATPARCLQIAGIKGIIAPGADADFVFLNPDLEVLQTMVSGHVVFQMRH
jgi:N-acetylglucosamine-6-phosphate deacetylase